MSGDYAFHYFPFVKNTVKSFWRYQNICKQTSLACLLQHHLRRIWCRPILPGTVAWRNWQAVQFWGFRNMDNCGRHSNSRWLYWSVGWQPLYLTGVCMMKVEWLFNESDYDRASVYITALVLFLWHERTGRSFVKILQKLNLCTCIYVFKTFPQRITSILGMDKTDGL